MFQFNAGKSAGCNLKQVTLNMEGPGDTDKSIKLLNITECKQV